MKKENSILTIIIIILSLTIVGLIGYITYDKILSNNDNDVIENKDETSGNEVNKSYNIEDVAEKVYGKDMVPVNLILWNDGTFSYKNDVTNENGLGRYSVIEDEIHLDFVFDIKDSEAILSSSGSIAVTNKTKIIKIKSKTDYSETHSIVELQVDNIILSTLNQPARSGEDDQGFYSELKAHLK